MDASTDEAVTQRQIFDYEKYACIVASLKLMYFRMYLWDEARILFPMHTTGVPARRFDARMHSMDNVCILASMHTS